MDFIPIELAGRTYRLRFTASDVQEICRRLTIFEGGGKVMPSGVNGLGTKLLNLDLDAFQFCLWAGMKHISEFKDADPADAMRILNRHIEHGGQFADLRRPFLRTLIACGFADFTPVLKALDDVEAKAGQTESADTDTEDSVGNGLTASSPFRTRISTLASAKADSGSSTSALGSAEPDH
jgi:hypothetical protein